MRAREDALIAIRPIIPSDKEPIRNILIETKVFTEDEVNVAIELIDIALTNDRQEDYYIYSAVDENKSVGGYYCLGPTPMTSGTYDLYWIAVSPRAQHHGIGKKLLVHAEEEAGRRGGRLIIAETSSLPKYDKTRTFYLHNAYSELARIRDYYRIGDDLVVYGKYVSQQDAT